MPHSRRTSLPRNTTQYHSSTFPCLHLRCPDVWRTDKYRRLPTRALKLLRQVPYGKNSLRIMNGRLDLLEWFRNLQSRKNVQQRWMVGARLRNFVP